MPGTWVWRPSPSTAPRIVLPSTAGALSVPPLAAVHARSAPSIRCGPARTGTSRITVRLGGMRVPSRKRAPEYARTLGERPFTHSLVALQPRAPAGVAARAGPRTEGNVRRRPSRRRGSSTSAKNAGIDIIRSLPGVTLGTPFRRSGSGRALRSRARAPRHRGRRNTRFGAACSRQPFPARPKPLASPAPIQLAARQTVPWKRAGPAQVSGSRASRPKRAGQSRISRRARSASAREPGLRGAPGRMRNPELLLTRCRRWNRTPRSRPIQLSRGPHFSAGAEKTASAGQRSSWWTT